VSVERRKMKNIERNYFVTKSMMHVGCIYADFIALLHRAAVVL